VANSKKTQLIASSAIEPITSLEEKRNDKNFCLVTIPEKLIRRLIAIEGRFASESESEPSNFVVVDATGSWMRQKQKVVCYQSARLVYGKNSYEEAIKNKSNLECFVIFKGKYLPRELKPIDLKVSIRTSTERITISEDWNHLTIRSDVFFLYTWRGYAPSILVENTKGELFHLIVGAKSLSSNLESIRNSTGQIIDIPISVRRLGSEKTSVYELRQRKA
jgi:hypothetical protein